MSNFKSIFAPETIIGESIVGAGLGAVLGGIAGCMGKNGLSFFNPTLASKAGTFSTFAGVGAIALPLTLIPLKIKDELLNNSSFLNNKPVLKTFIDMVVSNLILLASITAAAAMLGTPLGTTLLSMMILPLAIDTFVLLCTGVKALYAGVNACPDTLSPAEEAGLCAKI